jgi:two-component system KDP operon response regulator KdpE
VTPAPLILLVDDEPAILHALATSLDAQGYRTRSVASGEAAVAATAESGPDLILLDLGLPGMDGIEAIRRIRAFQPTTPIVVLSARGDDASKVSALDLGADDYVEKPFSIPELSARIRTALRHGARRAPLEASIVDRGSLHLDLVRRQATLEGRELELTKTQFDLLVCFARHPYRVLTHRMLAADVWGDPDAADAQNIRVHVSQLRRKLEPGRRPTIVLTEPGIGYRFVPPEARPAQPADAAT